MSTTTYLGDKTMELLLRLTEGSDRSAIAKGIASLPRIHCAFAMDGEWDIYAAVAYRNGAEFTAILSNIFALFGNSIRQKGMVIALSLYPFRSKLGLGQETARNPHRRVLRASHADDGRTT